MTTLLLIHGGLWEAGMDAERFWAGPGIVSGLRRRGFQVLAPDRPARAPSWAAETDHLAMLLPDRPVTVLAGSNGCSVAVRLALALPDRVERLVLAWPATAADPAVDTLTRASMTDLGAPPEVIVGLLAGGTLRGVADAELAELLMPVGVLPAVPDDPFHLRHTVDALLGAMPHATELPGCPEPPRADFPPHRERFLTTITAFATG